MDQKKVSKTDTPPILLSVAATNLKRKHTYRYFFLQKQIGRKIKNNTYLNLAFVKRRRKGKYK